MFENIRPLLDLDFHLDAKDTHVTLRNKGLGVAVITAVMATKIDPATKIRRQNRDPYRLLTFDEQFDWNMCTTFPDGRLRYLRPGDGYILFHIDKKYLLSQQRKRPWIRDESIDDICHGIHHQIGQMLLKVELENVRGDKMPPFEFDFRQFFPLPGMPYPRLLNAGKSENLQS
ncbi:hypothetical protein [Acidisoma silvae]|uniref:Uncharacterized protein n=1 Tax=Acidisoma silvae TaxID=2802396 RepID=A0A963YW83_9PROT|nr:hypothetical protein [Acidisoma silvae]MCB8878284.1 hypothetical protein [Acidisoma silvae]